MVRRTLGVLAAASLLAWSCGEAPPLASTSEGPLQAAAKKTVKEVAGTSGSVSADVVDKKGGTLKLVLEKPKDRSIVSVSKAKLKIPKRAMGEAGDTHTITMAVSTGTTLADIDIAFSPSGMDFREHATLFLVLVGPVTQEEVEQALHIRGDGTIERIETEVDERGRRIKLEIDVPGFSRYNFDDDGSSEEAVW